MTEESQDLHLDADAVRAQNAVRELGDVVADPEYRARLRTAFVEGRIGADATRRPRPTAVRARAGSPRPRWRRLVPIAAVAALLVLMFAPYLRGTALTVVSVHGARQIVFNGKVVSCADLTPIQASLHPGCRIEVPADALVEVAGAGEVLMDLQGIEFTFPARPHPLFGGGRDPQIKGDGMVRLATAPGFAGQEFRLRLGDTDLKTHGSVFMVTRNNGEIGINVLEGEIEASLPDGSTRVLGPRSGGMIRDGAFVPMDFDAGEAEVLETLRERAVLI